MHSFRNRSAHRSMLLRRAVRAVMWVRLGRLPIIKAMLLCLNKASMSHLFDCRRDRFLFAGFKRKHADLFCHIYLLDFAETF